MIWIEKGYVDYISTLFFFVKGQNIFNVTAVDGDSGVMNKVSYSIANITYAGNLTF